MSSRLSVSLKYTLFGVIGLGLLAAITINPTNHPSADTVYVLPSPSPTPTPSPTTTFQYSE